MGKSTFSGPVSGAYMTIPVYVAGTGATEAVDCAAVLPAGMTFRIFGVIATAEAVTAATFILGTSGDPNGYIESTAFVAGAPTFVPFDGALGTSVEIGASADLDLAVTVTTTLTNASVSLVGYVTSQTTLLDQEGV